MDSRNVLPIEGTQAAEAMLVLWSSLTGADLSSEQQEDFLSRPTTQALATFSVANLVSAANKVMRPGRLHLDRWLREVSSRPSVSEPEATPVPQPQPSAESPSRRQPTPRRTALRSRDGRIPQRPVDWKMAKKIGPVQSYDDTF